MFQKFFSNKKNIITGLLLAVSACQTNHIYNENTRLFYGYDQDNSRVVYGRFKVKNESGNNINRSCNLNFYTANIKRGRLISYGKPIQNFIKNEAGSDYYIYAINAKESNNRVTVTNEKTKVTTNKYAFILKSISCKTLTQEGEKFNKMSFGERFAHALTNAPANNPMTYTLQTDLPLIISRDKNKTYFGDINLTINRSKEKAGNFLDKITISNNIKKATEDLVKLVPELKGLNTNKAVINIPKKTKKVDSKKTDKKLDDFISNF
jgi:hypothetical protein